MRQTHLLQFVYACIFMGCMTTKSDTMINKNRQDPHSYAKPDRCMIKHLDWSASIDFDRRVVSAVAKWDIVLSGDDNQLILDTYKLKIKEVRNGNNEILEYSIGEHDPVLGSPMNIKLTSQTRQVIISYETSEDASALQWLLPEQTADKTSSFLFTQSQAILARSWIPIQDSPGIRFTYSATVNVPEGLLAVMSASNPQSVNPEGTYKFEMKQPIPAYLMALAVGDFEFSPLGDRCGVYAEPALLKASEKEFEDLEKMITVAESLYGPYRWERYDLIVLPPSFPFGGMENPRLTFATPTILAGDKSLTSLVAHELAHSWSGNLVTNATWDDFWLNEGFTVYFEYRIMEELYGREYSEMLTLLSLHDLKAEIEEMTRDGKANDTSLKLDLTGRNPDDGMTAIAYDKGYFFLRMLEEAAGRARFDAFLKNYFDQNAFKVMTTEQFLEILIADLTEPYEVDSSQLRINEWVYGEGLPDNCPIPVSDKFEKVEAALQLWIAEQNRELLDIEFNVSEWSTHEWLHFIRNLPSGLTVEQMGLIDQEFGFTKSTNSEVFAAWAKHVLTNEYTDGYDAVESFLVRTGRRKFLMPLYEAMVTTASGKDMALQIYKKARPNYHFVSTQSIDKLLEERK